MRIEIEQEELDLLINVLAEKERGLHSAIEAVEGIVVGNDRMTANVSVQSYLSDLYRKLGLLQRLQMRLW